MTKYTIHNHKISNKSGTTKHDKTVSNTVRLIMMNKLIVNFHPAMPYRTSSQPWRNPEGRTKYWQFTYLPRSVVPSSQLFLSRWVVSDLLQDVLLRGSLTFYYPVLDTVTRHDMLNFGFNTLCYRSDKWLLIYGAWNSKVITKKTELSLISKNAKMR